MAETHFDDWIARRYARLWPELFEPAAVEPVVATLAEMAGPGQALEFGIGTGRVAVPLAQRGVRVRGIELLGGDGRRTPPAGRATSTW